MRRAFLLAILTACAGAPDATSPPPVENATTVALVVSTPVASGPVASAPVAPTAASSAVSQCDDHDLDTVSFRREHVGVSAKPGNYVDKRAKAAVIACFEEIPRDRRSTGDVHAVTLEWPNTGFEGSSRGGFGSGFGAGGGGDYPPKVRDDAFTACVTKAIPKENVSLADPGASKISAIKLTVLAYTRAAANRHLRGSIGPGGGGSGYGRATRPCERPDRDE